MLLWTLLYKFLYEHIFFILLGIYQGLELLGCTKTLCLTFWGTIISFFSQSYCTILHCHQLCMRFPISPYLQQHLYPRRYEVAFHYGLGVLNTKAALALPKSPLSEAKWLFSIKPYCLHKHFWHSEPLLPVND